MNNIESGDNTNKILILGAVVIIVFATFSLAFAGYVPFLSPLLRGEVSSTDSSAGNSSASSNNQRTLKVVSPAMEPTIMEGATIVIQEVPFSSLKVNDIIVYKSTLPSGMVIVARIVEKSSDSVITKGDSNPANYPWNVNASLLMGKVTEIRNP